MLQRKLERLMVLNGGAPPATGSAPDEDDECQEEDEENEPIASISGIFQTLPTAGFKPFISYLCLSALMPAGSSTFGLPGHLPMILWSTD